MNRSCTIFPADEPSAVAAKTANGKLGAGAERLPLGGLLSWAGVRGKLVGLTLVAITPACFTLTWLGYPWWGVGTGLFAVASMWLGVQWFVVRQLRALIEILDHWLAWDLTKRSGLQQETGEFGGLASKCDKFAEKLQQHLQKFKRTESALQYQSLQKTAVSALGHFAFVSNDFPALLDQVMILVQQTLQVEFCEIVELAPDGTNLRLRAGLGWKDGYVGKTTVRLFTNTLSAYAFQTGEPVVMEDIANESRFNATPLLTDHGVTAGVNVRIAGRLHSFGILGAYTTKARRFTEDEIHFLMGAAKVLAEAIEQAQSEVQLEKLAAFIRFNPNPVLELSADGKVTYFNNAAAELAVSTGHSSLSGILPSDIAETVQACLTTHKGPQHFETQCGNRTFSWSLHPVPTNQVVHVYLEDITNRLSLEAQFRQAQKMESVGQLAAGIAHDFNNILTIISGHANILVTQKLLSTKANSSALAIEFAAGRAAGLTRQLLMLSRKTEMEPKLLDLRETVGQLGKMLRRLIGESISLELSTEAKIALVKADASMVEQVIMNLAVNARDAMSQGGRLTIATDEVSIDQQYATQHGEARAGQFIRLSVTDTGCGMPPNVLARIFEPFFTTKEVGKGTGLGLATAHGIVKQHNGWIEVVSTLGVGTTFKIYFPAVTQLVGARTKNVEPVEPAACGGGETILLVEDDVLLRDMVESILTELGYRVLKAESGVEAFNIWSANQDAIHLLFTDMVMPGGISGSSLAQKMQTMKPSLKIIFTSGYGLDDGIKGDINNIRSVFLQKPYAPAMLAKTVRSCLDQPQPSAPTASKFQTMDAS